ncbi:hypothetical protein FHU10_5154 [Serratia fonticola]|jgi:uncharacterized protein YihD (DUF1040 family)|uniref:Uncharacterized protein n=1 Tax=Serratia fonticola TaxID=47917 RepID=A0A559TCZ2_SERFO|nr:hypothetical protein [Serratia fonticola]TQI79995.1 hypothetical protein FHU09_2550 [Serratia fonticola]TQI97979.1 hypothetical protein FHU11_3496 [Serratia fonticola]TVZ72474.1 hypothetical protein FHU10_5154 [Serratia fonticola]
MKDNELITLIKGELSTGLERQGHSGIKVWQSYQPTLQGMTTDPVIYLHKMADVRHGSPGLREEYDDDAQVMRRITTEVLISTYQVSGVLVYEFTDPEAVTPGDMVKAAARAMQSPEFQQALAAKGANVMRVGSITTVDVTGENPGYEQRPLFEIDISHTDTFITEIPTFKSIVFRAGRV